MSDVIGWNDLLYPGRANDFFSLDPLPQFDADGESFALSNSWWLAELSRLVYRHDSEEDLNPPTPRRSDILQCAGLRQLAFFNDRRFSAQAMLVQSAAPPIFAALVFRGTEQDVGDFLCDLETMPIGTTAKGSSVHRGFQRGLDAIWPAIVAQLQVLQSPVFFTGHSLGAALATLAATRYAPRAVYAFGSPRVGNAAFDEELKSIPVFRIVYGGDLVTTVPPEVFGFKHAGEVKTFGEPRWFPHITDFKSLTRNVGAPVLPLADHAPINYVRAMAAALMAQVGTG
jgi:hypothetical protein